MEIEKQSKSEARGEKKEKTRTLKVKGWQAPPILIPSLNVWTVLVSQKGAPLDEEPSKTLYYHKDKEDEVES